MLVLDESDLAQAVLLELDQGVLVCTAAMDRILLSNPAADRMLAHLDDGQPMPEALREVVAEVLTRRAAPGAFPSAVPLRSRAGSCLFVRAKTIPAGTLIVIAGDLLRERDVAARFRLSKREAEIVELVCEGLSNDEIAERLNLTVLAVKHYLHGIFTALDVRTRSKLIAMVGGIPRADG
jgi:DNA-binding NarL/FixJ family response regulator